MGEVSELESTRGADGSESSPMCLYLHTLCPSLKGTCIFRLLVVAAEATTVVAVAVAVVVVVVVVVAVDVAVDVVVVPTRTGEIQ